MSVSAHIPNNIKRVSKSVGYAIWLQRWQGLSLILRARLEPQDRAALAFMALQSLDHDDACMTADAALGLELPAGSPGAPFLDAIDQAAFWVDLASLDELNAYALACFERIAPSEQSAFLSHVGARASA